MKIKKSDACNILAAHDLDSLDDRGIFQILLEGCTGYENMDNEELAQSYANIKGLSPDQIEIEEEE